MSDDSLAMLPIDSVLLSPLELAILKAIQKGKTDAEISSSLDLTQQAVRRHLKDIRQKLNVRTRGHAVDRAVALGFMNSFVPSECDASQPNLRVGVVGCGRGGVAVLHILKENPCIDIVFASDANPDAVGVKLVNRLNIPFFTDYSFIETENVDVLVNVTGSEKVTAELRKMLSPETELMGGLSAMLMWQITEERRKRLAERNRTLREHESLCHLGEIIENIDSMADATYAIVDYASKLLNMPAGSLAICDDTGEGMILAAAKGFSKNFNDANRWKIRKGGLTDILLNQTTPLFFADIEDLPDPNPILVSEGVRSVLAAPLIIQRTVVGILYLNDFKKKEIRTEDISLFSLLTIYAALTVERVKSIEKLWHQSQHDGLTGLLNHHSLMEQIEKEGDRAKRHNGRFSILMIDIDNFKSYNDSFGHLEGNKVLKAVSRLLIKTARVSDTVGRFGGEEFCILVPELDKDQVLPFAERLVKTVAEYEFPNREVTISAGVASFPENGYSVTELIKRADDKLYQAKREGKNRVCG
ncbi:MAG TPA: diguanylate cyclase [Sedimenticola sp.]|nr:diguanylate cyclase [Sedimenticola sp.]